MKIKHIFTCLISIERNLLIIINTKDSKKSHCYGKLLLSFALLNFSLIDLSFSQTTLSQKSIFDLKCDLNEDNRENGSFSNPHRNYLWELTGFSFGYETISGDTRETLNDGLGMHIAEIEYTPHNLRWLKIGICPADLGFHSFKLTESELQALKEKYELVTDSKREPLTKLQLTFWRFYISSKLCPLSEGYIDSTSGICIRPFLGIGIGFNRIDTWKAGEGVHTKAEIGNFIFYRVGFDITKKAKRGINRKSQFFIRIEFIDGSLPDWNVNIVPEAQAIRGGRFKCIRIGIGVMFY